MSCIDDTIVSEIRIWTKAILRIFFFNIEFIVDSTVNEAAKLFHSWVLRPQEAEGYSPQAIAKSTGRLSRCCRQIPQFQIHRGRLALITKHRNVHIAVDLGRVGCVRLEQVYYLNGWKFGDHFRNELKIWFLTDMSDIKPRA